MRKFLIALTIAVVVGLLGTSLSVRAADIAQKAPPTLAQTQVACTPTNCSGWYGGFSLYGEGGNALNIGINQSIFQAGGALGFNGGYQFWNGSWMFAIQNDALYESQPAAGSNGAPAGGFLDIVHTKIGGNLAALLGASAPAPSQGPISIPQQLLADITSPYLDPGCIAFRKNTVQYCGGAGVQLAIGGRWTADIIYDYGAPTTKVNALQIVGLNMDYHF